MAAERARKRDALLEATDRLLAKVQKKVRRKRKPIRGADAIGVEVGKVINRKKVGKHYDIDITDDDIVRSLARFDGYETEPFHTVSRPNAFQAHLLDLLGVSGRL